MGRKRIGMGRKGRKRMGRRQQGMPALLQQKR
jgi:hypothetical protein